MECTVEYNGLRRRWAKSPIRDEQVLLHLSHGQTMPVVLMTCSLRAARFLSSSATRDSSNDAVADWHVVRHCARSNAHTHTHAHTRLTAFFRDYPGEPVPER